MKENQSELEEKPFPRNTRFTYTTKLGGISGEVLIGGKDCRTEKKVVIKQPYPDAAKDEGERQASQIVREERAIKKLNTLGVEGVCKWLDGDKKVDSDDIVTYAYFVTTVAEGRTLEELAKEYRQPSAEIPWLEILTIFRRLTALLAQAHTAGIVHNDIQPGHVFWDRDTRQLKLIDWANVVFYKEETDRVRPADDIHQVGRLFYKTLTGNDPPVHRPGNLKFGAIELPKGLDIFIDKALRGGYENDMSALNRDIEDLYERKKQIAEVELRELERQAMAPDVSHSELQALKSRVENWPGRVAFSPEVNRLTRTLTLNISERQRQADWKIAKTYLQSEDYERACSVLGRLVKNGATVGGVDIEILYDLCRMMGRRPPGGMKFVMQCLVEGEESKALEALLELCTEDVAQDKEAPEVVLEAVHLLTHKLDIPAVQANLEWLVLETQRLEAQLSSNRTARGRMRKIGGEFIEQTGKFKDIPLNLTKWQQIYHHTAGLLQKAKQDLSALELGDQLETLTRDVQQLHIGAEQIANHLNNAEKAKQLGSYDMMMIDLQKACDDDPTNLALKTLLESIQTQQNLARLNEKAKPGSVNDFERLLDQYKKILQNAPPQFASQKEQLKSLVTHWEASLAAKDDQESARELNRAARIAKDFPPLHTFLSDMLKSKGFEARLQEIEKLLKSKNGKQINQARSHLLSLKNVPGFANSSGPSYLAVLEPTFKGFDAWAGGRYEDARLKLGEAKKAVAPGKIRNSTVQKALADWVEPLNTRAEQFVNELHQARESVQSPPSRQDWPSLQAVLQRIYNQLKMLGQWNEDELYLVSGQITLHNQLYRAYTETPQTFVSRVEQHKTEHTRHPFRAVYEQWADNMRSVTQEPFIETVSSPTPTVREEPASEYKGLQPSVSPTFEDRLSEVESLIHKKNVAGALKKLRKMKEEEKPLEFQKSAARHYLSVLECAKRGSDALMSGDYKAARDEFGRACKDAQHSISLRNNTPTWQRLKDWLEKWRDKTEASLAALENARQKVERRNYQVSDDEAWDILEEGLRTVQNRLGRDVQSFYQAAQKTLEMHGNLHAYRARRDIFVQKLNEFEKVYPNHPYLPLYREWSKAFPSERRSPIWIWLLAFGALLFLVLVFVPWQDILPFSTETTMPMPDATHTPIPSSTPEPSWTLAPEFAPLEAQLLDYCRAVNEHANNEQWDAALQKAEEARDHFPDDFSQVAQNIQPDCDFRPAVARAGVELAQSRYDAALSSQVADQYSQVEEIVQHTTGLLEPLGSLDTVAKDYRDLEILRQCARYQQHLTNNNLIEAQVALEELAQYITQDGFRNDFGQRCKVSYDQAWAALTPTPPPLPTPLPATPTSPCRPTLPELVEPAENASHTAWTQVLFRWEGGKLCDDQWWLVTIDAREDFCPMTQDSQVECTLPGEPGKTVVWRVEIRKSDGSVVPRMITMPGRHLILTQPSDKPSGGCDPSKDSDGDGVNDCDDKCPNTPGSRRNDGCP